jgi:serine/threonine protein kinase/Tol biopolymer transport system component
MALSSGTKLGSYEIVAPLGVGGMGEVYRAKDTKLGREIALKVLPSDFSSDAERMARFSREAQVLASLNHHNIASIYGLEDSSGVQGLVMELVEGPTLADRIARGAIPLDEALGIAKQIAEALDYAHDRGIIHRDLKPANIKITPDGKVKILDFGLAKALEENPATADISTSPTLTIGATKAGIILGTAAYMSPEQARGKSVDRRADIWSFGAVLFEMLSGKQAFGGETVSDTLAAVIKDDPDWNVLPGDTPQAVIRLIKRCMTKDPKQRLRDIGEARITIENVLAGTSAEIVATNSLSTQSPSRAKLPWAIAGIATILLVAALWIAHPWAPRGTQPITRLAITIPADQQLVFPDTPIMAISHDGRNLVYVAQQGAVSQLYLRSLGDAEAKPIPGTAGALGPFFSPDGQWIAFFAGKKLMKISVGGGTPVTLADAPNNRGGSWGSDNKIVFSADFTAGLSRVSSEGGKPEVITTPDVAKEERTHRWPEVLPNAQGVIFSIGSTKSPGNYDNGEVAVLSFKTGKTTILVQTANMARYISSGHIVYTQAGVLLAAPFDADKLELTGQPVPVLAGVGGDVSSGAGYWAVSDDGTLVNVTRSVRPPNQNLVIMDRKGKPTILPLPPRPYNLPRFSPDGRKLAFSVGAGWGGNNDVWTYDLASNNLNRLTFGDNAGYPLWSPDGKQIAFQSNPNGVSIDIKSADGSGQDRVLVPPINYAQLPESWSSDGKLIAFVRVNPSQDLFVVPADGHGQAEEFQNTVSSPSFSPDTKWMAYSSPETGDMNIFVREFPGPGGKHQISTDYGASPKWTKKGKELIYLNGDKVMAVDVETQGSFHASAPHLLFELAQDNYDVRTLPAVNYDVTADGEKFVFIGHVAEAAPPVHQINVTQNWFDEVKRLSAPAKK